MATMRALRYHGAKDLRVEDLPVPAVKPGQVKVKPAWCGICGTGMSLFVIDI
jgi:threonine dehydrogenase-like Zn-dependent dehydrogenase